MDSLTPKHILLFEAFGWEVPQIVHLSVFLDPEGDGKMSKRKGSVSALSFLEEGYLPEAMLNYLMLLGWNPGGERELFTLEEFVKEFDLKNLNKSNQKFTYDKLNWFNQQYIRKLGNKDLAARIVKFTTRSEKDIEKALPLVKERLVTLSDFDDLTIFLFERPLSKVKYSVMTKLSEQTAVEIVGHAKGVLEKNWDGKMLETEARKFCEQNNIKVGDYFMVLRLAITGRSQTPPLWDVVEILGQEETFKRLSSV